MIRPIAEFFFLDPTLSNNGNLYELFPTGETESRYNNGLRQSLEGAVGIYLFYDSRGCALYVGKTEEGNLWLEAKNAFNRNLGNSDTRKIFLVNHPYINNVEFRRADEQHRRIKRMPTRLYDLATYISAYEVDPEHIAEVETLLIRAFPNDLLNVRMEQF